MNPIIDDRGQCDDRRFLVKFKGGLDLPGAMFTSLATALLLAAKLEFVVPDANFSLREGLPAVQVLSLYQDKYGALWVGTTAGLAQLGEIGRAHV